MSLRSRKDVLMFLLGLTPEDNLQQQYSDAQKQKQEPKLQQVMSKECYVLTVYDWLKQGELRYKIFCWLTLSLVDTLGAEIIWGGSFLAENQSKHQKGLIILPTAWGILADFWVPNEIDT